MSQQFSPQLVEFVKAYEGFRSLPYRCPGGHLTIGYGHKIIKADLQVMTEEEASLLLRRDLMTFAAYLHQQVKVDLTQGQYDALGSLIYNWGCQNFGRSKGLKLLNQGLYHLAAAEFFSRNQGVVHIGHQFCAGLYRRRQAEFQLWRQ